MKRHDTVTPVEAGLTAPVLERGAEPLPGYRLVEPLGHGGFGQVWKCEVPGGLFKAIKLVTGSGYHLGDGPSAADQELEALQRVKAVRHPFILSIERVEVVGGTLLIVTELADRSLREVLEECRRHGMPGVPRPTLLALLLEAAEALDVMNFRYGLQHLDVKPGNLFLVSEHVKVADFGQVDSPRTAQPGGPRGPRGAFTPLYAAPELLQGTITRHSDQYSLAVVYQELLTGTLPFSGTNARRLLMQRLTEEPDLGALPARDRPAVARALSRDPGRRFPSCLEFVRALLAVRDETPDPPGRAPAAGPGSDEPPGVGGLAARRGGGAGEAPWADRRVSVRYAGKPKAPPRVRARPTYQCDDVLLRDISALGVGLVFRREVRRGTGLFVQLPGRRPGTTSTRLAEVVHVAPWQAGTWLVGCKWARPLGDRDLRAALGEGGERDHV